MVGRSTRKARRCTSRGNAVPPDEVIKESGAEILRLWCASSNYFDDMRCSAEILQRVTDGYRKLRNTARFALGNLYGFNPERDSVAEADMLEIDRWALAELDVVTRKVRQAYDTYEFHAVYHALYNFCTVTLSARYFDIIKDRLYTFAPRNQARRSAQTALYRIADALAGSWPQSWLSLPTRSGKTCLRMPSRDRSLCTLQLFPKRFRNQISASQDGNSCLRCAKMCCELERPVLPKRIGSSLEARVEISASGATLDLLEHYRDELRYLFIVPRLRSYALIRRG